MSHRGLGYKHNEARLHLDMSKVTPSFDQRQPGLNHSLSCSKDAGSKAYAEAMKALQRKIKTIEAERDNARETAARLERRLVGGKDAWEQRLRESERSAQEMENKLRDTMSMLELSAQTQSSVFETSKVARSLKESLQQVSTELQLAKVESRERTARCTELEVKNKALLKVNADLQFRCTQLEQTLAEKAQGVSLTALQELSQKLEHLQQANEVLAQKLQYQQELSGTQKDHIAYLSEQLKDMHRFYSAEASQMHSPLEEPRRKKPSRTASLNASFSSSKKLLKEIRRYQKERNELEMSGRKDRGSKAELAALRKLIAAKSSQLKQTR